MGEIEMFMKGLRNSLSLDYEVSEVNNMIFVFKQNLDRQGKTPLVRINFAKKKMEVVHEYFRMYGPFFQAILVELKHPEIEVVDSQLFSYQLLPEKDY